MKHKLPKIREINLELKDFKYNCKQEFDEKNLRFEISVDARKINDHRLFFFVHIKYMYQVSSEELFTILHTDYTSEIEFEENNENFVSLSKIEKIYLAHLLGMSFLMIRGAIHARIYNNILNCHPMPIINPTELLDSKLSIESDSYILESVE